MLSVWDGEEGGLDGYEGKMKFMYLKWGSQFGLFVQNFIFPSKKMFSVFSGWMVWLGCIMILEAGAWYFASPLSHVLVLTTKVGGGGGGVVQPAIK